MEKIYDVIVVGGGTAGVSAAIQAGRAGAHTLLIDKQGILGGTLVVGAVSQPASFHAYGKQIIAGIGWELCCQARREAGDSAASPDHLPSQPGGRLPIPINPAIFAALADEWVMAAGVDLLFHSLPVEIKWLEDHWDLTIGAKTGIFHTSATVVVDCTGDANLVAMAGGAIHQNKEIQAATLVVEVGGYDDSALDYAAVQNAFDREVVAGRMQITDPGWGNGQIDFFLRGYGGNRIHVPVQDVHTSQGRTQAEIDARRVMLRLLRFCRQQPGLQDFYIRSSAIECGIRESVTIQGKKTITALDYESGRLWEDAVCYSFYPIDIHRGDHLIYREIPPGIYPTIPLGALLPEASQHILAAGRCAAGDWEANSAYRVAASCMAMGQAAGAAAALAALHKVEIEHVPLEELRNLLRKHGAIVPGDI